MEQDRDARIRQRAHEIWEREGRQEGSHDAHWQRAERELAEEEAGDRTDAPAAPQADAGPPARGASRRKR